jgi:hypothetical protein
MKSLILAMTVLALGLLPPLGWSARAAEAYVVEVTTSVALETVHDEAGVRDAVRTAVAGVLSDVIAFKPTLVAMTGARVVGERLYLRLLVTDAEGEREINGRERKAAPEAQPEDRTAPDQDGPAPELRL